MLAPINIVGRCIFYTRCNLRCPINLPNYPTFESPCLLNWGQGVTESITGYINNIWLGLSGLGTDTRRDCNSDVSGYGSIYILFCRARGGRGEGSQWLEGLVWGGSQRHGPEPENA